MINTDQELDRLYEVLKKHPKGLTIVEIAKKIDLNRTATSKYLNILMTSGQAEMRIHGPSKVFYPSQRVPISSMLNFSSSLLMVLNDNLSIIDVNNALLNYFSFKKTDLIGHRIDYSPFGSYITPGFLYHIEKALESIEKVIEGKFTIFEEERYITLKIIPTILEDGSSGVVLLADDVTELTKYRLNLEQMIKERSKDLQIINDTLRNEIADHKKARLKLKKSEQQYRELVENASCLIIKFDTSGILNFYNEFAQDYFGYSKDEFIGKNIIEFFNPEIGFTDKCHINFIQDLLRNPDKDSNKPYEIIKKDGSRGWVTWTNKVIRNSYGKVSGILAIGQDITVLKQVQDALTISEQRYRLLFDDNPSMFCTLDSEGKIISVNTFGAMQLGYTIHELEGQSISKVIYKNDLPSFLKQLQLYFQNPGTLYQSQLRKISKSGEIFWVHECASTIIEPNGKIVALITCHNITEQKKTEEKLQAIIEFLPDATFVINIEGKVIAWNHAIEILTGIRAENIIGKGDYEYSMALNNTRKPIFIDYALNPEREIPEDYFNCKREGEILIGETYNTFINPNGIYLWGKASPLYDSCGELIGAIESFRDITHLKNNKLIIPVKLTE